LTGITKQIVAFRNFAYAPKNQSVNDVWRNNHRSETNTKHCVRRIEFLGAFAKLWKTTVAVVMSVLPSFLPSAWNNSAYTEWSL
jgi:hypothetical protein